MMVEVCFPGEKEQWAGRAGVVALVIVLWGLFEGFLGGALLIAAAIVLVCAVSLR
jgi:hypothetical protein